jgi:phage tail-like protein
LVLTHGLTDLDTLWNWYDSVTQGIIRRKNGTIMLLDRQHTPVMWWNFYQAYPVKWVGPQLYASQATAVAVEQIELAHEGVRKHR